MYIDVMNSMSLSHLTHQFITDELECTISTLIELIKKEEVCI